MKLLVVFLKLINHRLPHCTNITSDQVSGLIRGWRRGEIAAAASARVTPRDTNILP